MAYLHIGVHLHHHRHLSRRCQSHSLPVLNMQNGYLNLAPRANKRITVLWPPSVLEFEAFATRGINGASPKTPFLLLILRLGERFTAGD
jgi:hypothetical protein